MRRDRNAPRRWRVRWRWEAASGIADARKETPRQAADEVFRHHVPENLRHLGVTLTVYLWSMESRLNRAEHKYYCIHGRDMVKLPRDRWTFPEPTQ